MTIAFRALAGGGIAAGLLLGAAAPASAVLATSIIIRSGFAGGDWLQIGEVQVFAGGVDVALASNGAHAFGTGSYNATSTPDKAIDGILGTTFPDIYHSDGAGPTEYLEVKFAGPVDVSDIVIYGRGDCCGERNLFSYELHGIDRYGDYLAYEGTLDARNGSFSAAAHLPSEAVVPEPASWVMMVGGFGLVGGAMRTARRRTAARFV